jgi:hypothetical protein
MSIHARIVVHDAITRRKSQVCKVHVWNDATGNWAVGNYRYRVRVAGKNNEGAIKDFPRSTPNGAVELVRIAMHRVLGALDGPVPENQQATHADQ